MSDAKDYADMGVTRGIPPVSDYAHWNEDAERIWYEENRYDMEHGYEEDFDPYDIEEEEEGVCFYCKEEYDNGAGALDWDDDANAHITCMDDDRQRRYDESFGSPL